MATIKMAGTYKGEEFSGEFRAIDVFEKKDGKWQAIYSQITKIEEREGIAGRFVCRFAVRSVREIGRRFLVGRDSVEPWECGRGLCAARLIAAQRRLPH